jgi:hypothetical protein
LGVNRNKNSKKKRTMLLSISENNLLDSNKSFLNINSNEQLKIIGSDLSEN